MNTFIPRGTLPGTERADIFDGHKHGDVPISMFLVHNQPGDGPEPHRHPYPEIFVVHDGRATFQLDESTLDATAGDVVIAPPGATHSFTNAGPGELSMTCIHTAARTEIEWV